MEPGGVIPKFWELKRKPRLLVVEDDNDVGNLLKICFTDLGMDVTVTVMGREGLALFSTQLFDLVMLDVNLPDIDGFEVMRVIRSSSNRNVPVYFLTQRDERAYKLEGLGLGADDYITKPFDLEELKLRVHVGLRHRQNYLKVSEYNQVGETSGHVFVSYSHKDSEYTHKLAEEMERHNIPVWIDDRIDYGTRWPQVIQEKIDSCQVFVLIMSDNARASDWVNNELTYAIGKGKKIYPVLLKGDTWLAVASIQYVNVRNRKLPEESFYKTLLDAFT
ncbi:MAG TPA: response regulator [Anaerolineales bacterium]|nr:response regulator [Anaerolineales bacterium]